MSSLHPRGGVMRRLIYALLLLLPLGFAAAADNGTELEKLYNALNMLDRQQQGVYQHFQMVQEVRRGSIPLYGMPAPSPINGEVANYDAMVATQRKAIERDESLSRQADELLARYNEIEGLKAPLQARIYELTLNPTDRAPVGK